MTGLDLEKKIKRNRRHRRAMAVVAALIFAALMFALLYKKMPASGSNAAVSIEISCDQLSSDLSRLKDQALVAYIPEDGIILAEKEYPIRKNETTVFDILEKACMENEIQLEYSSTPVYGGHYIESIQYLYEFSAGKYSGWIFTVDGETPNYGSDKVKLSGGEKIVWFYCVDYRIEREKQNEREN